MELVLNTEVNSSNQVGYRKCNSVLTNRDLDICRFLLEMKFASVDEVHKKFFKVTLLGLESKSFRAAWKRLNVLEELGFIKAVHHFQFLKRFYIPTLKAFKIVEARSKCNLLPYPSKSIDIRTFEHDLSLLNFRIEIENANKGYAWISDKQLRSMPEFTSLKKMNLIPDGIFINNKNQRICFEYEKAIKSKKLYRSKIRSYMEVMRSHDNPKLFDKVIYACENLQVQKILTHETELYRASSAI